METSLNTAGMIAVGSDAFHVKWLTNMQEARCRIHADIRWRKWSWPGSVSWISSETRTHSPQRGPCLMMQEMLGAVCCHRFPPEGKNDSSAEWDWCAVHSTTPVPQQQCGPWTVLSHQQKHLDQHMLSLPTGSVMLSAINPKILLVWSDQVYCLRNLTTLKATELIQKLPPHFVPY